MYKNKKFIIFVIIILLFVGGLLVAKAEESQQRHEKIISLDFKSIGVRELLQFIADTLQLNIIMSDSISGNVSLHFHNMTWQQALDTILEMSGLVKKITNNVLFIATPAEFAARQKVMSEASSIKMVKVFCHHVEANLVATFLKNQTELLTPQAKITCNPHENSLWIKESVENLVQVISYVQKMDRTEQQIMIVAKIINIDDKKIQELGINFAGSSIVERSKNNEPYVCLPDSVAHGLTFPIASLAQSRLLNLQLDALEQAGHSKTIANPKLITQNHKTAIIEAGEEIPYQESAASGATSVNFKKAALSLRVTPTVLPDKKINLEIEISQNKISPLAINGSPVIQTQELKTQVSVKNGQTIILGGIFEKSESEFHQKPALIGDIPILGKLVSHKKKNRARKQLLILVSPQLESP